MKLFEAAGCSRRLGVKQHAKGLWSSAKMKCDSGPSEAQSIKCRSFGDPEQGYAMFVNGLC